jgi:hypothetical protein
VELLEQIQVARDFMSAILADRKKLQDAFGDGSQVARMRALLEAIRLSGQNVEDKRVPYANLVYIYMYIYMYVNCM